MSKGIRCSSSGAVLFDSSAENVLMLRDEQSVSAAQGQAGITFSYPDLAGWQVSATLISPFSVGTLDRWAVLSCRVSYAAGYPQVSVFIDNPNGNFPVCDGQLTVFQTGAKTS